MSVYWDKAKKRWRFEYNRTVGGHGARVTKLFPKGLSRTKAEALDRKLSQDLYLRAQGVKAPERLTIQGAVDLYIDHRCPTLANGKKAIEDLTQLGEVIEGKFLDELDQVCMDYKLTARKIEKVKGKKGENGEPDEPATWKKTSEKPAPATIRNRLAYLRAAVNYARISHSYGQGQPNHTADMSLPVVNNERQVYAKLPELETLWNSFKAPEAAAMFKLVFYCGLRWRAELKTRTRAHIIQNGDDVWLDVGKTKNGEPVMKFVNVQARPSLAYIPFVMSDAWYYDRWHEAAKAIGRPELKPHDLRHSLASYILSEAGGSLDSVRSALHHKSLQAANRYAHRYPESQKDILASVNKIPHQEKRGKKQK